MAQILLIDSNPENRKSIEGLLRYRTRHVFESVATPTDGARKAVSFQPDLIMMNVLMFMGKNYAFPRVMQQHDKTMHISFLVHANGPLDEVTEKQIQASGMATFIYLPASADELEGAIQSALEKSAPASKGVAPVVWQQASKAEAQQAIRPEQKKGLKKQGKAVQWPQAAQGNEARKQAAQKPQKATFRHLADVQTPKKQAKQGFRAAAFEQVDSGTTKGRPKFKRQSWEEVDPKDVK